MQTEKNDNKMFCRNTVLVDSDGDGVIDFRWDTAHPGIDLTLEDIFGNVVTGTFYKNDLLKILKQVVKELKNELV